MTFVLIGIYFSLLFYLIINIIPIFYSKEYNTKTYREELLGLPPSNPTAVGDSSSPHCVSVEWSPHTCRQKHTPMTLSSSLFLL